MTPIHLGRTLHPRGARHLPLLLVKLRMGHSTGSAGFQIQQRCLWWYVFSINLPHGISHKLPTTRSSLQNVGTGGYLAVSSYANRERLVEMRFAMRRQNILAVRRFSIL